MYVTQAKKEPFENCWNQEEGKTLATVLCDKNFLRQAFVKGCTATCVNVMSYPGYRNSEGSSNKAIAINYKMTPIIAIYQGNLNDIHRLGREHE